VRVHRNSVAGLHKVYRLPDLYNSARKLVPQYDRRMHFGRSLVAVVNVNVCPANTAKRDLDENLVLEKFPGLQFTHLKTVIA
jgi:hypothetical protein